ncbi:MAG: hypothetical protein ACRDZ4_15795 [Egibacteraceae bacterium]
MVRGDLVDALSQSEVQLGHLAAGVAGVAGKAASRFSTPAAGVSEGS